jgi:hypothetical protein
MTEYETADAVLRMINSPLCVVPAQAGTHNPCPRGQWFPAFAGTSVGSRRSLPPT